MRPTRAEVYRATDGWRWRMIAGNGRVLADSGEAYEHRVDCEHGLSLVRDKAPIDLYVDDVAQGTI